MYKLKNVAKRGSALLGAVGLLTGIGTSALPALTSADSLNPLTQRSLTLSSSSPGWSYLDGSGNTTYAYPGSGANGQKTGNFYSFRVSSTHSVNALTFQYCINPAGNCIDQGDDSPHGTDTASTSDLKIVTGTGGGNTPAEISSGNWASISTRTEANAPTGAHAYSPKMDNTEGNFVVLVNGAYSGGWTMSASNQEEGPSGGHTGNVNMITLINNDAAHANPTNGIALNGTNNGTTTGDQIQVKFFATNTNYITNPGRGYFFVKINDYEIPVSGGAGSEAPVSPSTDANPITGGVAPTDYIIDGGVTVANVMNESIEIQTKVLETMQFSVGTVDPDTLTTSELTTAGVASGAHGACDNILTGLTPTAAHNVLLMGDPTNEYALSTSNTYGAHSYWRLSSNSSAGATVYYAGTTLHDTEGDQIKGIGTTAAAPQIGSAQFGLAIDNDANPTDMTFGAGNVPNGDNDHFGVNHDNTQNTDNNAASYDYGADNGTTKNGALDDVSGTSGANDWLNIGVKQNNGHNPQLYPLLAQSPYNLGGYQSGAANGPPNTNSSVFNPALTQASGNSNGVTAFNPALRFAFDPDANTHPAVLATENSQVVDCVTAKMRYIANIAAVTPAGIYTTKINYIAAPQY